MKIIDLITDLVTIVNEKGNIEVATTFWDNQTLYINKNLSLNFYPKNTWLPHAEEEIIEDTLVLE